MKFVALGDTEDVGASCHFLHMDGTGLVLDAGTDPRREGPHALPRFDILHDHPDWYVDHAIVTHAHHDHMGALPVLIQQFPHVVAHMTEATRKLVDFLLPASARLQRKRRDKGETEYEPLFEEDELELYNHLYLTHDLQSDFDVTGMKGASPVTAQFYTAGHILGSAGVELRYEADGATRRLFYTSDTNVHGQSIIPGATYPEATDILVLESTLGADPEIEQTSREEEVQKFKAALQRVIGRGGTALVPVFVMGRAQEILALINRFKKENDIPSHVPVYTAGSMRAIADVYDETRHDTPRHDPDFKVFDVEQERLPYSESGHDEALQGPSIHVMSSGMMFEPTLSNLLARQLVEDEKNGILLVGFAKEGTPAHRLKEAYEDDEVEYPAVLLSPERGPQPLRCEVGVYRLTGHSNRRDLLGLVDRMQPQHVLLVHGETEAREWMADNINHFHADVDVHLPQWGEPITL